jgi:hypothetical protein
MVISTAEETAAAHVALLSSDEDDGGMKFACMESHWPCLSLVTKDRVENTNKLLIDLEGLRS